MQHALRGAAHDDDLLVAKANCGIPEFVDGAIRYGGTAELMANYACLAIDAGARIIGGCCGTTPEIVRAMRDAYAQVDSIGAGVDPYLFTWTRIGSAQALLENGLYGDSFDLLNDLLGSLEEYAAPPGSDSAGVQDDAHPFPLNLLSLFFEKNLQACLQLDHLHRLQVSSRRGKIFSRQLTTDRRFHK